MENKKTGHQNGSPGSSLKQRRSKRISNQAKTAETTPDKPVVRPRIAKNNQKPKGETVMSGVKR